MRNKGLTRMLIAVLAGIMWLGAAAGPALALDIQVKYTIPAMKSQADADKIVGMMKALPGFKSADVFLHNQTIIYLYNQEKLENEKMELLIPLKKAGYPVERRSVLFEERETP